MAWNNTKESYGWAAIALHWIVAAGVIAMLVLGFAAEQAGEAGDRAARSAYMGAHVSLGSTLFVFFAVRIALHYLQPAPVKPGQGAALNALAVVTQHALLIGLLIQMLSGPLAVWSGARDIHVFNLLTLPTPFAARSQEAHEAAELAHAVGRWTIIVALGLHVAGVLKHLFIDRDGVLMRMLKPGATLVK